MPTRFSYIWIGANEIPLFKWLSLSNEKDTNPDNIIHIYSIFHNRPVDPLLWKMGKRIFYSGESVMDEVFANVVVGFMPSNPDNNFNVYHEVLDIPNKKLSLTTTIRPSAKYIQLRLQELDAIEWKIKGLLTQNPSISHQELQNYLLTPANITPYSDLNINWSARTSNILNKANNKKFCLFMVSNGGCKLRNDMFMLLSRVAHVDSTGQFRNNMLDTNDKPPDRLNHNEYINYLSQYKFMITFENKTLPYYHTEKIMNAFEAGVIPIYWGDPYITEVYDNRSFIHVRTFANPNEQWDELKRCVSLVDKIHQKPELYAEYFKYTPINETVAQREDNRVNESILEITQQMQ